MQDWVNIYLPVSTGPLSPDAASIPFLNNQNGQKRELQDHCWHESIAPTVRPLCWHGKIKNWSLYTKYV